MGLFDKLLGKKQPSPAAPALQATPAPEVPATVRVWDSYGRLLEVPREEWRKLLPGNFQAAWTTPDKLADLIVDCLRNGFFAECLDAAQHLHQIDSQPKRGATLLGATLLQLKRFEDAEKIIVEALKRHGDDGTLLVNLARSFSGRGDDSRAERALWRGLEVDPNQDTGLPWFATRQRERGGPPAEMAAYRRVAALPGSWRAQLWLARQALAARDVPAALALYREVLPRIQPMRADALMQISADLGSAGLLREIVEICAPHFAATQHGLGVGNNLIKAYVDLRDAPNARRILEQLSAQQRPDWREQLVFWESEIDKLDKGYGPAPVPAKLDLEILVLDGPLWGHAGSPFAEILPVKTPEAVRVAFVCGSAEMPPTEHGDQMVAQPTDPVGRLTRGLPLFLAERTHIKTTARALTLVPWLQRGGFVLSGAPWTLEALAHIDQKLDYVVFLHVIATAEPWVAKLSVIRRSDGRTICAWEQSLDSKNSAETINEIGKRLFRELKIGAQVGSENTAGGLFPPAASQLPHYVAVLDQALAVSCSALAPDVRPFLTAERNILDSLLNLCLREMDNPVMRFLLLSTVQREAIARPDVAGEYRERLERLQREHPLSEPAQGLAQKVLAQIFAEAALPPT
jgi:tetratricopeptide (TPR) repeat protein